MELTVLGAAPAYTDRRGSAASSYLLRAGGAGGAGGGTPNGLGAALLFDIGQGSFANLAATLEPSALTGVLVSHLHPDHLVDLVPLRHYLKWEFDPPRRVRVIGPAGLGGRIDALDGHEGFAAEALDVEALSAGVHRIGPFEIEVLRVTHTEESYAFRVVARAGVSGATGAGFVYSGDCACAEDLAPLIHPGDTFLCEASFGAGPVAPGAQHITSGDAARVAAAGGAARLLLTHILSGHSRYETLAAAQSVFAGPIQLVTEGDRFEI
jgi:ribonuclease BN (tRNA processing enzyme)